MSRLAYNDPGHAHFLTFGWYHHHQFLTHALTRKWLAQAIDEARERERFSLWAFVFMPDHVHLLLHPRREQYSISAILRRIKEPVSRRVVMHYAASSPDRLERMAAQQGKRVVHRLWQAGGGYDRNLMNWDTITRAIDYIEYNPVRRGLVWEPTEWVWSSARARAGEMRVPLRLDSVESAFVGG